MLVLPARFLDAGDQPVAGHVAEANAADAEFAVNGPRPAAQLAAEPDADLLPRRHQLVLVLLGLRLLPFLAVRLVTLQLLAVADALRFGGHGLLPAGLRRAARTGVLVTPRGTACRTGEAVRGPRRRCGRW